MQAQQKPAWAWRGRGAQASRKETLA